MLPALHPIIPEGNHKLEKKGLNLREAFRGFGPRKQALQREVDISDAEWEILADLDKSDLTEMQLEEGCIGDMDLRSLLCGLIGKGYITGKEVAGGSELAYTLTELGSSRLATLRQRFDAMLFEQMVFIDPDDLRATLRNIEVSMARNGISLNHPRWRFH